MVKHAALVALAACGAAAPHRSPVAAPHTIDITLYRDVALVRQRIAVTVDSSRTAKITLADAAANDAIADVTVLDRGGLDSVTVRAPLPIEGDEESGPVIHVEAPTVLDVAAPHAGTYTVEVAYVTRGLAWEAAYTVTTTPARNVARVTGALAVHSTMHASYPHAVLRVVDAELGTSRARAAEQLAAALVRTQPSTTPRAVPRDLGVHDLVPGETRIDLAPARGPRPMRSVLVYDPVGTALDHPGVDPMLDAELGLQKSRSTAVTESLEISRDVAASVGLPSGPARLLEQREDGSFAVLGVARLFEAATRVATVDTIPLGTADGVTGHRQRLELTLDENSTQKRVIEEFAIEVTSTRSAPVDVLIREHLYRGLNWAVAYSSTDANKDGVQQITMRTRVPVRGTTKVMYVVVYSRT